MMTVGSDAKAREIQILWEWSYSQHFALVTQEEIKANLPLWTEAYVSDALPAGTPAPFLSWDALELGQRYYRLAGAWAYGKDPAPMVVTLVSIVHGRPNYGTTEFAFETPSGARLAHQVRTHRQAQGRVGTDEGAGLRRASRVVPMDWRLT